MWEKLLSRKYTGLPQQPNIVVGKPVFATATVPLLKSFSHYPISYNI